MHISRTYNNIIIISSAKLPLFIIIIIFFYNFFIDNLYMYIPYMHLQCTYLLIYKFTLFPQANETNIKLTCVILN